MNTKIVLPILLAGILLGTGCSKEAALPSETPGDVPVSVSGIGTRNDGVNGANLYMKAFKTGIGGEALYFGELLFSVSGGLNNTEKPLTFPITTPYYPIDGGSIALFAFSGKLREDRMVLKAGHGDAYDAVLSNQGYSKNNPVITGEGAGTIGSSSQPAELLVFRHVMTRLNVTVVVDETEDPPVDPVPANIQFRMADVAAQGLYAIRASAPVEGEPNPPAAVKDGNGFYTVQKGVNYLVPTGATLSGKGFTYLKIDDYTATAADLAGFVIDAAAGNTNDLVLLPGYAYDLEIKVRKLRVTGVTVRLVDWNRTEVPGGDVDLQDYPLDLTLGQYENTGDDRVTKAVLYTADRMYVGEAGATGSAVQFVRLPEGNAGNGTNVTRVELYTDRGLLLQANNLDPADYTFDNTTGSLTLDVSKGGMVTANGGAYVPGNPYLVQTPLQLMNVEKEPALNYRQAANLDMNTLTLDQAGDVFVGVRNFSGTYDGNGYLISNLDIRSGAGLFFVNDGTLQNIRIFSGTITTGATYAGGICGTNNGTIVGCVNSAQVVGSVETAGGICGLNSASGTVVACLNTGNIPGGDVVGGICGENRSTTANAVTACVNTGMLNSRATSMGGICGLSVDTPATVFQTSFWLVGSAEHYIGITGIAVGTGNVGIEDCSALDPIELRAVPDPNAVIPNDQLPILRLNTALTTYYPSWGALYQFVNSYTATGLTWPTPMKK